MPLLAVLLFALVAGGTARADTLTYDPGGFFGEVSYIDTGTPNLNRLAVSEFEGKLLFQETHPSGSPEITSSGGCVTNAVTKTRATCPFPLSLEGQRIWIRLGGNSDTFDAPGLTFGVLAIGDEGDDTLGGGEAADWIVGGTGDDILHGMGGADRLQETSSGTPGGGTDQFFGDAGNDTLVASESAHDGAGNDIFNGGTGTDRVVYDARQVPIVVDLPAGKVTSSLDTDSLIGIEDVTGTDLADAMQGDGNPNSFAGRAGNDVLKTGPGNDFLDGGGGDDELWPQGGLDQFSGGEGNDALRYDDMTAAVTLALLPAMGIETVQGSDHADTFTGSTGAETIHGRGGDDLMEGSDGADGLHGGPGADQLSGGAGNDVLEGGGEVDQLDGGGGDDTIRAVDRTAETIGCGIGNDTVEADDIDTVLADCESVTRVAPSPGTDPGGGDPAAQALLTIRGGRVKIDRKRRGKLRLGCTGAPCAGTLAIKVKRKTVAKLKYSLAAGQSKRVTFRLNRRGRRLLKTRRRVAARARGTKLTLHR
jgi:hypothetical protein